MFIELKSFQLPQGHNLRLEGTVADDHRYEILWDIAHAVVWITPKGQGRGKETNVYSCVGARMTPKDPEAAMLLASGFPVVADAEKPKAKKSA